MELGKQIKKYRVEANLPQEELGYFNIKGLAENDLFGEQLSEELVNIGTSMK